MAEVRNLKQKIAEEQQKAVHFKNLYANAAIKLDNGQGRFNKKAADKLERAVKQISTGTSLIREVISDLRQEVMPTSERDKLRHHLKRAAAGIGLNYVQDPKKRCTSKDMREMPALTPAEDDEGKKDVDRSEDESEDEEETEDSEDDQNADTNDGGLGGSGLQPKIATNYAKLSPHTMTPLVQQPQQQPFYHGMAPMNSWQDYYGSAAAPMHGNFGQMPQHSYYDWSDHHQWQQQSQQQLTQQQHGFGTHKKAD